MTLHGAIFDVDGTLMDSMPIWNTLGERYLHSIGVIPENNLGNILFTMSLEEGANYLKGRYSLPLSLQDVTAGILKQLETFYREEAPLKAGVIDLLNQFRKNGIPMILASTGSQELITAALERLGVLDYFTGLMTATELQTTKHEPLIYQTAASIIGTKPGETAVFEDTLYALESAKRGGFLVVAVEDAASAADQDAIRALSDFYIRANHFMSFWEFVKS